MAASRHCASRPMLTTMVLEREREPLPISGDLLSGCL
jgi:hypothetical protein